MPCKESAGTLAVLAWRGCLFLGFAGLCGAPPAPRPVLARHPGSRGGWLRRHRARDQARAHAHARRRASGPARPPACGPGGRLHTGLPPARSRATARLAAAHQLGRGSLRRRRSARRRRGLSHATRRSLPAAAIASGPAASSGRISSHAPSERASRWRRTSNVGPLRAPGVACVPGLDDACNLPGTFRSAGSGGAFGTAFQP